MKHLLVFLFLLLWGFGCTDAATEDSAKKSGVGKMRITSAFEHGRNIPAKYTCEGVDVSPMLRITDVPGNAKSLALIVDDPDAPTGTWIHWAMWNIPPETKEIPEGANVGVVGITSAGSVGYHGPCPPRGPAHTYRFKLYALDVTLGLKTGATVAQLEAAMEGHVLAMAELDGEYQR